MTAAALVRRVRAGLDPIGLEISREMPERLARLAELVAEWGQRINLSGHRSPGEICDRLILDAAALGAALPRFDSLADLGSGAGFPGLPVAILWPRARVVLVEARQRRHHFQRAAVRELGLDNAVPRLGRIEDLEPEPCDVTLAQAVGPAGEVVALIRPWARPGGWLAIPASEDTAMPAFPPDLALSERPYRVPGGPGRRLWLLQVPG